MISVKELSSLIFKAVTNGSEKILLGSDAVKADLSKCEAYARYGRTNVERWMKEGLVGTSTAGEGANRGKLNKIELKAVAASSNRISYLPVADR